MKGGLLYILSAPWSSPPPPAPPHPPVQFNNPSWRSFCINSCRSSLLCSVAPRPAVWMCRLFSCRKSWLAAVWCVEPASCSSASVDHLHLPPTPPSSHSSDSEGSLSPNPRLHPFGLPQTHSPARAVPRAPSALSSSPLLTAPHVSLRLSWGHELLAFCHLALHPERLPFEATWLLLWWGSFRSKPGDNLTDIFRNGSSPHLVTQFSSCACLPFCSYVYFTWLWHEEYKCIVFLLRIISHMFTSM